MLLKTTLPLCSNQVYVFVFVSNSTRSLSPGPIRVNLCMNKVSCAPTISLFTLLYVPDRDCAFPLSSAHCLSFCKFMYLVWHHPSVSLIYVSPIVCLPLNLGPMYVILWFRYSFLPLHPSHNMYYICSSYSLLSLFPCPQVWYYLYLKICQANWTPPNLIIFNVSPIVSSSPSTLVQRMFFYVSDKVASPFTPLTLIIILCPWYSFLSLLPNPMYVFLCSWKFI